MAKPTLHLIGNDRSAPKQVVQWCLQQWPKTLPPNLLFCVPSALAMRRLRDELVRAYGAFHGVRFTQPAGLIKYFEHTDAAPIATEAECLCVWDRVFDWLTELDTENRISTCLFPGNTTWLSRPMARYTVAQRLMKLRATLVEAGLNFGLVSEHPATLALDEHEQNRWAALSALEMKYEELMMEFELEDPTSIQFDVLLEPFALPIESEENWRLIVACVPDMMPSLGNLFEAAPQCDILIQTSDTDLSHFTDRGTPDPQYWATAPLHLPEKSLLLAEMPTDEALCVEAFLGKDGKINPSKICLGVLNHEIMTPLTGRFETNGIEVFEPDPIQLSKQPAARLLSNLFQLAKNDRIEFLLPILTIPETAELVKADYTELRKAFVELIDTHRPGSVQDLVQFLKEGTPEQCFIQHLQQWLAAIQVSPCEGAVRALIDLYGTQYLDPVKDAIRFSTFETLQQLFAEILNIRVPNAKKSDALLLTRIQQTSLHPIRGTAEASYEGRFEILWSNADQVAIAGLNEGVFPDTKFEDAFLPNTFRKALGLRSDATRIARDAYILDTLCKRYPAERLQLSCSRTNNRGDWTKPSRLFFHCDLEQQKERAEKFFLKPAKQILPEGDSSGLRFTETPAAWLATRTPPTRFSASAIRTFLRSPLLYFLRYEKRLKETAPLDDGVQQNVFGTLIHETMESLRTVECSDETVLRDHLIAAFDNLFTLRYGQSLDVELEALRLAAHKRLQSAATCEAALRKEGWRTMYTEADTRNQAWEVPLRVGKTEVTLYGQIDRIDYNPTTQVWRVIDYKTGASSADPDGEHFKHSKGATQLEWYNFQLPIYRLLTRHALNLPETVKIEMAYFSLPAKNRASVALMHEPIGEVEMIEALRDVLKEIIALSEETLLKNPETLNDPLLKHLLLSCQPTP